MQWDHGLMWLDWIVDLDFLCYCFGGGYRGFEQHLVQYVGLQYAGKLWVLYTEYAIICVSGYGDEWIFVC